jgi:orotidine-5'-phosphate decarboxylase
MPDPRTDVASRIVFALDFATLDAAHRAALAVREAVGMFKVGLELFVQAGPAAVAMARDAGRPVFLDLKLHDIPETVDRAVGGASSLGARVVTVHASGGAAMLSRAVERAEREGAGLVIAAVTVLTSMDARDLGALGVQPADVAAQVRRLARVAHDEGVRAFVCSPHEVVATRAELGAGVTIFTPGVRSASAAAAGSDDQKRVATAAQAISAGADWVVVGRPIRDAKDPLATAREFAREVEEARRGAPTSGA